MDQDKVEVEMVHASDSRTGLVSTGDSHLGRLSSPDQTIYQTTALSRIFKDGCVIHGMPVCFLLALHHCTTHLGTGCNPSVETYGGKTATPRVDWGLR